MAVRKNKNGSYTADVYDIAKNRIIRVFKSKKDAQDFVTRLQNEKRESRLVSMGIQPSRITFDSVLSEFLLTKERLRPKSRQKYGAVIRQFSSFLKENGIAYLNQFTADHASAIYRLLVEERKDPTGNTDRVLKAKPKTVNFYLMTIKAVFNQEVEKGNLARNPFQHIKNLRLNRNRCDYYTAEELTEFFKQEMNDVYRNAFSAFLFTGMRFAELANLVWEDVDLRKRLIRIRSNEEFQTKTYSSERIVPINTKLFEILNTLRQGSKSAYVFTSVEGCQLRERKLLAVCKQIAESAGIRSRAYLHKFRHTFATHLVNHGVGIEKLQKLLGHANISETLIYAHVRTENLHSDVEILSELK